MVRSVRGKSRHRDEGFSVLEVVLAAFILFFVLTAMLGLVGTTTRMNQDAKARTAMTNAVSSHIEWVRSLDFVEVGIRGSTAESVVEPQYTYTIDGFTVTIDNQIREASDGTKELAITATAARSGYPTVTMTSFTALRDLDEGLTRLVDASADAPLIQFGNLSPAENEVVYSSYRQTGGSNLYIDATAEAKVTGGYISDLRFYCAGELLRDGNTIFANVASWQPGTSPTYESFHWDTRQVNDSGDRVIEDGWRLVSISAIDNEGREGRKERRLYVDNFAPDKPGVPGAQIYDDVETRLSWAEAEDGTDPAAKYQVATWRYGTDGTLSGPVNVIVEAPAYLHYAPQPFSRFAADVRAGSPRNLWSDWVSMAAPYTTRPRLEGTSNTWYVGKNNLRTSNTEVSLNVTPPSFGYSAIRYDLYRSMDPAALDVGAPYKSDVGPSFDELITKNVGKFGSPDPWYYQYKVTYTALGAGGGTSEVAWSNIVGPISVDGSQPMEHVSW